MSKTQKKPFPDSLQILCCRIVIWEPKNKKVYEPCPKDFKDCMVINECVDIEYEDTYKKLITNAVVRLPQGAVIRKSLISKEEAEDKEVYVSRMDDGALVEARKSVQVATPSHFSVGQRISIFLGYYTADTFAFDDSKARKEAIDIALRHAPDFDGYIVKCSVSTPIEIKCENLASALKRKTCKDIPARDNVKVNDLLGSEKGNANLLEGTGLKLYPQTQKSDMNIGKVQIYKEWTVADLLSEWNKYHLYSYIKFEDDIPYVAVGRSYFSGSKVDESVVVDMSPKSESHREGVKIYSDYHVAKDDLTMMNVDPLYLAVEAQCYTKDDKFFRVTITLNPDWKSDDPNSPKFRQINETKLSKKSMKFMGVAKGSVKEKVDLSQYTVIPYMSRTIGISEQDLIKEAIEYFNNYNCNGVEGSLTIFGDLHLRAGSKIELIDKMHPAKNGEYLVDEVTTKFGVNGYRQTIKMPYCISKPKPDSKDGEDTKRK